MTAADPSCPRRVVVLGATGCVGGAACTAFLDAGHQVLAVARTPAPRVASLPFVPLDVAAALPEEIAGMFEAESVDVVVNATGGWLSSDEANEHRHVQLVDNLLAATALMPDQPRLVQIGSIHEYGPVPEGEPIGESVPPHPVTTYARTKLAGSTAVLEATRAGRANGVVLRSVNVCGPHVPEASFLGTVVRRLCETPPGRRLELNVAPTRRDFIDVRDLAAAIVLAATAPVAGLAINIGRGEAVPIGEILALLLDAAGLPGETLRDRGGRVESRGAGWTLADIRLAGQLLGWEPRIGLRRSVQGMWAAAGLR